MFICIFVPILKAQWITVLTETMESNVIYQNKATNKRNSIRILQNVLHLN